MKKDHLNNRNVMRGLIPLTAGVMLMFPACKKTEAPQAKQATADSKHEVHFSSANSGNADAAFNAFNSAFLVNSGGQTYYKKSINDCRGRL
jgi:hypothetical protein